MELLPRRSSSSQQAGTTTTTNPTTKKVLINFHATFASREAGWLAAGSFPN